MENKEILEKIETELKKLAVEYGRHAALHKKHANFWAFAMIASGAWVLLILFLPLFWSCCL